MFLLLLVILLTIGFRYLYLRFNKKLWNYFKQGPYGDAATYFFLIQFFRHNNCGVPDKRCLITQKPVLVPSLYLRLVSRLFTDGYLFKYSWLPNFILYTLGSIFYCLFLYYIFGGINLLYIFSIILFLTLPDNLSLDKHRIQFAVLQPRFMGMLINSSFWLIYVSFGTTFMSFFILCILGFISLNISIFSRQSFFFLTLIFSIISINGTPLIIFGISVILSSLIFYKEFIPSIMPQIQYSYQYFLNYYKPKKSKNRILNLIKTIFGRPIFESYPYITFFIVFGSIFIVMNNSDILSGEKMMIRRSYFVVFSILIIYLVTGIRKFAFLGECWRYISYNTYFLVPFLIVYLLNSIPAIQGFVIYIFICIILFNIFLSFISKKDMLENKNNLLTPLLYSQYHELKSAIWYGVPYRVSSLAVALGIGKATFEYQYGNHSKEILDEYFSEYPFLKWDNNFVRKMEVTHILVEEEYFEKAKVISKFSTKGLQKLSSNGHYSIYKYNS